MILYERFFKQICVRKKEHIFTPRFFPITDIELPRGSIYHFIPQDATEYGIEQRDLLINRYDNDIYIDHIQKLDTPMGNPIVRPISFMNVVKKYHNTHKRFKLVRNIKAVMGNKLHLIVENYGIAQQSVNYRPSIFSNYYRWYNMQYTVMKKMTQLQLETERPQFMYLQLPGALPQLSQLRIYSDRMSKGLDKVLSGGLEDLNDPQLDNSNDSFIQDVLGEITYIKEMVASTGLESVDMDMLNGYNILLGQLSMGNAPKVQLSHSKEVTLANLDAGVEALEAFESKVMKYKPDLNPAVMHRLRTPSDYWLLHFWMWCGINREASLFSMLDHNQLKKIHIILGNLGAYTVLRLDVLENWRESLLATASGPDKVLDNFSKHMLKFITKLFMIKTGGEEIDESNEQQQDVFSGATMVEASYRDGSASGDEKPDTGAGDDGGPSPETEDSYEELYGIKIPKAPTVEEEAVVPPAAQDGETKPDDAVDIYEERSLGDDIDDDEFNHDRESRVVKVDTFVDTVPKPEDGVDLYIEALADAGMLTAAEYKRYKALAQAYKQIPNPTGEGTLEDLMTIDPGTLTDLSGKEAPDSPSIIDKGMLSSALLNYDSKYIDKVMDADIANVVMSIQNSGIVVIDYNREEVVDAATKYVIYSVQVQPVGGKVTTIRFKIPKIESDGTYVINGVKSRMKKQRVDIPIRKVSSTRVSLTSYYGKLFMERSSRSVYNYGKWLGDRITALTIVDNPTVTNLILGRVFNPKLKSPHVYALLAQRFISFVFDDYTFIFDHKKIEATEDPDLITRYANDSLIICGKTKMDEHILMDKDGMLYEAHGGELESVGDIESLLGLDSGKAPVEMAELKVQGKFIPVGFIIAYYYGLSAMIEQLKLEVRIVPRGEKLNLQSDERVVMFNDESIVFSKNDRMGSMLLHGFNNYSKDITKFSRYDFDRKSVYLSILSSAGLTIRWLRELDLLREMFVDPITRDELIRMKAPVKFDLLLLHGVKLLLTDQHLRETSSREQRARGYERISGAVYLALVKAARTHKTRNAGVKAGLDLHPEVVWYSIMDDTTTSPVEECNPLHNIKETEDITYGGTGGRTGQSMTAPQREYIDDNMGMIAESSTDNADVGYRGFMPHDPLLTDLRGNTQAATEDTSPTNLFSTTALLVPGVDRDDELYVRCTSDCTVIDFIDEIETL